MNEKSLSSSNAVKDKIKNINIKLKEKLNLVNHMEIPKISKIVLNIGLKDAVANPKVVNVTEEVLQAISGQKPLRTFAKKSIAGFKLREGMPIGVCVTLRGKLMYAFFDKLINLALPRVRDFHGVSKKFDGKGNYNLGIKEWSIFPEVEKIETVFGMNITIVTTAKKDIDAYSLLEAWNMPFHRK